MKKKTYRESVEELEQIVASLRDGKMELEQIRENLMRANALLEACSSQLRELQEDLPDGNAK